MPKLRWNEFLAQVCALPGAHLDEETLFSLVERLEIDCALLAPFIQFRSGGYARNVLYRDARFEAICLCWEPGQGTAIHSHGGSFGVVAVFDGSLDVKQYRRIDDGARPQQATLAPLAALRLSPGTLMLDHREGIHEIFNRPEASERAISLHFYAGPLAHMEVFDRETGAIGIKPMLSAPIGYRDPETDAMAALI